MVNKLLHIVSKRMVLEYSEGTNVDDLSDEFGHSLFLLYKKKEIYVCNASLESYIDYLGIPKDVYEKYRKEIIKEMIVKSLMSPDDDSKILLMKNGNYILDDENKIEDFNYL